MDRKKEQNQLFQTSHLMVLNLFTILGGSLIGEALLLKWETWALVLIAAGIIISWTMHIRGNINPVTRLWIYSFMMMATYFFYGAHLTSTYDLAPVMLAIMSVYTMTCLRSLVTLCQVTFYLTFAFGLIYMYILHEPFDSLVVTRSLLHIALVTVGGTIARTVIDKWEVILGQSAGEISMLRAATQRLNDFLANISHEIRTPINAVIGLTGVCIGQEKDPAIKKDLLSVEEAGKRVAEQISDILDYSEIDMQKLAVSTEDYMLSSLLNDLVNELKPYRKKGIELVIDVDAGIPNVMHSDVFKLKKILWHLILNGLKYTQEGGIYVHIAAAPREYGINLCIEVTDTGIGMSEAELEQVLERFYQVDSSRTRNVSGLGLGLTIVNGFVRSLDGFLTIESRQDEGTTIRISIPQKVVDESVCMKVEDPDRLVLGAFLHFEKFPNAHVRDFYNHMVRDIVCGLHVKMHRVENIEGLKKLCEGTHFTHLFVGKEEYEADIEFMENLARDTVIAIIADEDFELPPSSKARIMPKPFFCFPVINVLSSDAHQVAEVEEKIMCDNVRALVVDDEPMNLTVAMGIFKQYGMQVFTASSGIEAIEACLEQEFDIIFMDHMMPGMDGVETMKRIRSEMLRNRNRNADIPIVALTANTVSAAKEMFFREGFDGFIGKPIEIAEFERVIRRVLPKSLVVSAGEKKDIPKGAAMEFKAKDETDLYPMPEDPADDKDPFIDGLKSLNIDTDMGLAYCQNDLEFYKTLLGQYGTESLKKLKNIETYLAADDLPNYAIVLHSIKSTSKMIGAPDLSEKARELELAAKGGDLSFVVLNNDETVRLYKKTAGGILDILGIKPAEGTVIVPEPEDIFEFAPKGGDKS